MPKVNITEVALRDAHQSLIATRMSTEEMLPILEAMDEVGYFSLECWGGATFDSAIRFLDEDPWERLRILRKACPKTKLQMLFRGQNMLGYRHYGDDVVAFIDGEPAPHFRADYILRGMLLPAGEHTVEFRFRSLNFGAVNTATLICSIIILLGVAVSSITAITKSKTHACARQETEK